MALASFVLNEIWEMAQMSAYVETAGQPWTSTLGLCTRAADGMLFGAAFLLAFAGGLAGLYSLRPEWVTVAGLKERMFRLKAGLWSMAAIAWATVVAGTFIVYPWYRAKPPEGATDLSAYPRYFLLDFAGGCLWIGSLTLAGYWFGNLPFIKNNLTLVILVIIALSLLPVAIGYLKHRREAAASVS